MALLKPANAACQQDLIQKYAKSGLPSQGVAVVEEGAFLLVKWNPESLLPPCVNVLRHLGPQTQIIRSANCNSHSLLNLTDTIVLANDLWKLSPKLEVGGIKPFPGTRTFLIRVLDKALFEKDRHHFGIPLSGRSWGETYILPLSFNQVSAVLASSSVIFIDDRTVVPRPESPQRNLDLSVNRIELLHQRYPELRGSDQVLSLKENLFDIEDIDFKGRFIPSELSPDAVTTHATNMATMMIGAGNSEPASRGVALEARITVSDFFQLMPDTIHHFESTGASVQNHSYGVEIENYYGMEAEAYDQQVAANPFLVHVFSAGNYGDSISRSGPYQGIPGFANLTGTFKMAKNVLVVGGVDTTTLVPDRSSRGPAFDGRIKPDVVAYGQDGSSGASAITSGIVALIQEEYYETYQELPDEALVRALLISSADDIHSEGPDFLTGFGNIHAARTLQNLKDGNFFLDDITAGEIIEFEVDIPEDVRNIKVTLCWTDPPATLFTDRALINDLDLKLQDPSGFEWLPWVLNVHPYEDSLKSPAIRATDSLNNVEQVTLDNPDPGLYRIKVQGSDIAAGAQRFSLAVSYLPQDLFIWSKPVQRAILKAGNPTYLRWDCTFENQTAQLEYKLITDQNWLSLDSTIDLAPGHYRWDVPDIFSPGQVRMTIGNAAFVSDTFMISPIPVLDLGFDCTDSLLLHWSSVHPTASYQLLRLGDRVMEPIGLWVQDTQLVLKEGERVRNYAVQSQHPSGFIAGRSSAINVDFQSAGCFIQNFLADLLGDEVRLKLSLGSLYGVHDVFFEKSIDGFFTRIFSAQELFTEIAYLDANLKDGANLYRAGVMLATGQIIYSDEILIRYSTKEFLVVPNPVPRNEGFTILSKNIAIYTLTLFDLTGKMVLSEELFSRIEFFETDRLPPGVYFYTIHNGQGTLAEGVLLLQ